MTGAPYPSPQRSHPAARTRFELETELATLQALLFSNHFQIDKLSYFVLYLKGLGEQVCMAIASVFYYPIPALHRLPHVRLDNERSRGEGFLHLKG